ncbi:2,3,4,5-tetrahydropyridine-2,6-dicarboxylate N-succinyltransferase [Amycolatopsis sp. NPDC004169]|uniref:2,3,4,5-tetrahydropyridine-2,6-dicarboxylate N-succinyltransferase n=1 Tax=Amycolatopsis sp. NPDC004169 TaxID=3154453 RepID=UPI0033B8E972
MDSQPSDSPLADVIEELWLSRASLSVVDEEARAYVTAAIDLLDRGKARVAWVDEATDQVVVDERAKRAILLSFKLFPMKESEVGEFRHNDRLPLKRRFDEVRVVPGAIARWGSHLAPGVVLMPSFVNIGGYVGAGTMIDTWATVGSCAQLGRNVHVAGGAGIGGVLEPESAAPVVVEDDAFIGSRCAVVEGARIRRGAKLGAGTVLTASTRVFDATTGEELARGELPAWSVGVGSARVTTTAAGDFAMPCVLVVRHLEEGQTHEKLQLNEIFREHGTVVGR